MGIVETLNILRLPISPPVEREDIAELKETARVKRQDLIPFFTPSLHVFLPKTEEKRPQRLFHKESLDERSKRRFARIFFRNPTLELTQWKGVPIKRPLAPPPTKETTPKREPALSLSPAPIPLQHTELKTYFDRDFGKWYFVPPPWDVVTRFFDTFQAEGGYCKITCTRITKSKNPHKPNSPEERCDLIALTKDPRQVKYESQSDTSGLDILGIINTLLRTHIESPTTKSVKEWQANQEKANGHLMEQLPKKIKEWNYDSFMIAGEKLLLKLGYTKEAAMSMHLLALFYKQVPMEPQS
jgi:hypothetical protein